MTVVALVVNPHAGRDVRRITSLARTVGAHDQRNLCARILAGLAAAGVDDVLALPEPTETVARAAAMLAEAGTSAVPRVTDVDVPGGRALDAAGTTAAATAFRGAGAACVLTVGGDGTNRAVVAGWPEAVLAPVAGGTNNALALPFDPSAVGLAAGRFAADPDGLERFVRRRPALVTRTDDGIEHLALVDVALTRHEWVGAHALWDPDALVEVVVARSDPTVTGLAGLAGMLQPRSAGQGLHLVLGHPGTVVLAPLGPGRFVPVSVRSWQALLTGDTVTFRAPATTTIALDGEREVVLGPGRRAEVHLVGDGPRILDASGLLDATAAGG